MDYHSLCNIYVSRIINTWFCFSFTQRLPRPGETLHGTEFRKGFGGKGANQCVAAAKLGASATMVARVSRVCWGQRKNSGGLALPYLPAADTCLFSILFNIPLQQFSVSVHKNAYSNDDSLQYPHTEEGSAVDQLLPHILHSITFSSWYFSLYSSIVIKLLYTQECCGSDNCATGNTHCGLVDIDETGLEGCRIVGSLKCHCHPLWDFSCSLSVVISTLEWI